VANTPPLCCVIVDQMPGDLRNHSYLPLEGRTTMVISRRLTCRHRSYTLLHLDIHLGRVSMLRIATDGDYAVRAIVSVLRQLHRDSPSSLLLKLTMSKPVRLYANMRRGTTDFVLKGDHGLTDRSSLTISKPVTGRALG